MRDLSQGQNMTCSILLVDDEPNLLHSLVRVLRKQPYHIYTAHCAEEALQIIKMRSVDLVVSDENMPGKSGTELLTWIAEHLSDVVRIVLTGQPSVPTTIRAINDAHVFRFFTKPCDVVQLALAIREGLELKDFLDQQRSSPSVSS